MKIWTPDMKLSESLVLVGYGRPHISDINFGCAILLDNIHLLQQLKLTKMVSSELEKHAHLFLFILVGHKVYFVIVVSDNRNYPSWESVYYKANEVSASEFLLVKPLLRQNFTNVFNNHILFEGEYCRKKVYYLFVQLLQ